MWSGFWNILVVGPPVVAEQWKSRYLSQSLLSLLTLIKTDVDTFAAVMLRYRWLQGLYRLRYEIKANGSGAYVLSLHGPVAFFLPWVKLPVEFLTEIAFEGCSFPLTLLFVLYLLCGGVCSTGRHKRKRFCHLQRTDKLLYSLCWLWNCAIELEIMKKPMT